MISLFNKIQTDISHNDFKSLEDFLDQIDLKTESSAVIVERGMYVENKLEYIFNGFQQF